MLGNIGYGRVRVAFLICMLMLSGICLWANPADDILKASSASNKAETMRLLHEAVTRGDFALLDKVRLAKPELFSGEYFPPVFIESIIQGDPATGIASSSASAGSNTAYDEDTQKKGASGIRVDLKSKIESPEME